MINRKDILEAYSFMRRHNHSLPDELLDFMKDASLSAFDSLDNDYCKSCKHNGNQMIYPSACTGCGSDGEKRHYEAIE